MAGNKLRDSLVDEVKDMYNAEKQLTKALPKMVKARDQRGAPRPRWRTISKRRRTR